MANTYSSAVFTYNKANLTYNGILGGSITISGGGAIVIAVKTARLGTATISGNGSLVVVGISNTNAVVTVSGNGSLTVIGVSETPGTAVVSGGGSITITDASIVLASLLWDSAVKDSQREISYYVRIYFDGTSAPFEEFNNEDIAGMTLLEETFAETNTPLGAVSANELVIEFYNENNKFSPRNSSSDYYGKLLPKVRIDVYIGIKVTGGYYEYVDLGTFYATGWSAPTGSVMASVVCNDYMYDIMNRPMPQLPAIEAVNGKIAFELIFKALGLTTTQYSVDSIEHAIVLTALPEGENVKVRDALQLLADRCLVCVYSDRDGVIRVIRNNNVSDPTYTWKDTDMVVNADIPIDYSKIYSQIEASYYLPFINDSTTVFEIGSLSIPYGTTDFDNLFFNNNVGIVENVELIGATNSYINSMTIGGKSISLSIINTGDEETVTVRIIGRPINDVEAKYTLSDATAQSLVGNIKYPLNNKLIQSRNAAITMATRISAITTDPDAYITIKSRGNPKIELPDAIKINDNTNDIVNLDMIPIRMKYNFLNGMECEAVGIKKSLREAM